MSNDYFNGYLELEAVNNFLSELRKKMEIGRNLIHEVSVIRISMTFRETYHSLLRQIEELEITKFDGQPKQNKFKKSDKEIISESLMMLDQTFWRIDYETLERMKVDLTREDIDRLKKEFENFPDSYFE